MNPIKNNKISIVMSIWAKANERRTKVVILSLGELEARQCAESDSLSYRNLFYFIRININHLLLEEFVFVPVMDAVVVGVCV